MPRSAGEGEQGDEALQATRVRHVTAKAGKGERSQQAALERKPPYRGLARRLRGDLQFEPMHWEEVQKGVLEAVERLVPPWAAFILVDEGDLYATIETRRAIPFLEREGEYWGSPPDDETAIHELERLRSAGADRIVFASQAFWWLTHYRGLDRYLRSNYRRVAEDDRVIAFDLTRRRRVRGALNRRLERFKRRADHYARRLARVDEEPGAYWARVVMNRETRRLVEELDPGSRDALEISGTGWQSFGFASYRAVGFPDYDVCAGPLEESAYDIVIAEQVLEHLLSPRTAVENVRRMLRPDGVFLVTTPFLVRVHGAPVDCSRWTELGLLNLLAEGGFDAERTTTGSWGNRACVTANFERWVEWVPLWHSLRNEPDFPVVVWALAPRERGGDA